VDDRLDKFLKELSDTSKKYGIYVTGCGCCGSPYLSTSHESIYSGRALHWDKKKETYVYKSDYPLFDKPVVPLTKEEEKKLLNYRKQRVRVMREVFERWADGLDLPGKE
jgi:hypothetical protein